MTNGDNNQMKSELKYQKLFESSKDGLVIVNVNGGIIDANQAYCKMLGYTLDELKQIGNFYEITPKRWHEYEKEEIWKKQLVKKGCAVLYEKEYIRKDGKVFPVELQSLAVFDEQGRINYLWAIVRDITQRKHSENVIKESHLRLLTILDSLNAMVYVSEMESHDILFANQYVQDKVGDVVGKKCWEALQSGQKCPCDFCTNEKLVDTIGNPKDIYRHELQNKKTGRWYDCQARAIKWIDDRIVRLEIGIDITDRKQAEETLCKEYSFRKAIIDKVAEGLCVCHAIEKFPFVAFTVWNDRMTEITGYTLDEINRLGWYQTVYPDPQLQTKAIERMKKMREGEDLIEEEWEITRADGNKRVLSISSSIVESYEGTAHVLALMQDITERKHAEDRLRENEQKYRTLFEETLNPILMVDEKKRYIDANKAALEFLECERKDLLFRDVWDFAPPEKLDIMKKDHTPFFSRRTNETAYVVQGAVKTLMLNVVPLKIKSETVLYGIGQDITKLKQTEKIIEASLREKETLLKEIHHRVKNNMQVISSLLNLQIMRNKDEQARKALMDCRGRIGSMAAVHEMLYKSDSLSHIDCQAYISKLTNDIMRSYQTDLYRIKLTIDAKGVTLGVQQASPLGLIINELLSNALKYGFPENMHGRIMIRLKLCENNIVKFVFSDNGIGIPEDLDWKNTKSLGLNLVVLLTENQLDGTVSLAPGEGTCFTIKFNREINRTENDVN